ncbi:TlpA family protein disulfide reductase [Evansella sp. LMS18]|uniref:TlpA disulfide reductase family protein n=1 Tax=Evansella sp. LMS18 TaxID=2924033 RepID=UPI0020D0AB90|nr:TlpA disulfide reductase family protein [Evansella sp. LMS18]UTR09677.1 TlpA family protein disulfide reductase [Evansella sp. LMS18]
MPKAPSFTLPEMLTEKQISLADFTGKAVLITFWVSWCPDSQRDLPAKEHLNRAMQTDDLAMIMINVTGREAAPDAGEKFYKEQGFTFLSLKDNGTNIYDLYQCMSVPTTYLLNADHHIAARFNDKASFQEILQAAGQVLSQ